MRDSNDHAGRIPKQAFITSVLFFLAFCIVTAAARFFIRIRYQKQVSIDDAFLLFGLCCMISAVGVIFVFIDSLYLFEAIEFGTATSFPDNFKEQAWAVQKYSAVSLVLEWFSIVSVKFSFIFFFRRLVDRVPAMKMYWWAVLIFNTAISCYGVSVYFVACPHFYRNSDLLCGSGAGASRTVRYSLSQIVLDILGDLLILYIPIHLILRIHIRWTQKLALSSSLCLTLIIIAMAIIKASGIRHGDSIDTVWEIYFQTISAEIGLIMTAGTAFRAFFVAKSHEKSSGGETKNGRQTPSTFRRKLNPKNWLSKMSDHTTEVGTVDGDLGLGDIPGAKMTGIRTFIEGSGKDEMEMQRPKGVVRKGSRLGFRSEVKIAEPGEDELWPLQGRKASNIQDERSIMVKMDVSFLSERNSSSSEYINGSAV